MKRNFIAKVKTGSSKKWSCILHWRRMPTWLVAVWSNDVIDLNGREGDSVRNHRITSRNYPYDILPYVDNPVDIFGVSKNVEERSASNSSILNSTTLLFKNRWWRRISNLSKNI
jgi:hypothetical protein